MKYDLVIGLADGQAWVFQPSPTHLTRSWPRTPGGTARRHWIRWGKITGQAMVPCGNIMGKASKIGDISWIFHGNMPWVYIKKSLAKTISDQSFFPSLRPWFGKNLCLWRKVSWGWNWKSSANGDILRGMRCVIVWKIWFGHVWWQTNQDIKRMYDNIFN